MPGQGKLKPCSCFVVRYVPDPVRNEGLNIGVLLHSPEDQYLGCLFADDFRRVKRFDPRADLELLGELQQHFEREIDEHEGDLEGYLRVLGESLGNVIQLEGPQACLLRNPWEEMQDVLARHARLAPATSPHEETRWRIKQRLTAALVRAGVWRRLEKRIPAARWTQPGDAFTVDYGYKPNGTIKLIHALSLKRDTQLAKALVYTLNCVRRREPAEMAVVVERSPDASDLAAVASRNILEEARIRLYTLAEVDGLAQTVRAELGVL